MLEVESVVDLSHDERLSGARHEVESGKNNFTSKGDESCTDDFLSVENGVLAAEVLQFCGHVTIKPSIFSQMGT